MTDNQSNAIEKQPENNPSQNTQAPNKDVAVQKSTQSGASTSSTSSQANGKAAEPQIKKVDIAIAGVTYPIFCPVHEQEELLSAVSYINNYALDLKRDAPSLSQESILVLCCLNLYEKIHANQRSDEDRLQKDKQSQALLNKIMKDAHSIL
ncbi:MULTISPECIES: cell division protein ZapA [Psychrobacter]|jgi:cell division protein ZapA|uniref:cell division protein ZapA n=1 Tax=Psychrobacter TaxID=497 RepID=UPI001BB03823|nr:MULTISPECIES: cell division protein ZapA [Psychrobacter]MEC9445073.1 cell division protein ZapA [Pseudomonadota bacterium]MED6316412.1 cell division protein ZapA [Pseudomonadota bacterium]|tara:strand:- start:11410 stop:11862 length:453 start_codon:yes stop_codon:yes gene_type:complete